MLTGSFNNEGRLVEQGNNDGEALQLTYSGAQVSVSDAFGNSLNFISANH